jgi:hypothetical protein
MNHNARMQWMLQYEAECEREARKIRIIGSLTTGKADCKTVEELADKAAGTFPKSGGRPTK